MYGLESEMGPVSEKALTCLTKIGPGDQNQRRLASVGDTGDHSHYQMYLLQSE